MEQQRIKFEKWYGQNYSAYPLGYKCADGSYSNLDTNLAWEAWKQSVMANDCSVCEANRNPYASDLEIE